MAQPAALALEGGDPRFEHPVVDDPQYVNEKSNKNYPAPHTGNSVNAVGTGTKLHDPRVTLEEYMYFANISRTDQRYEDPNHDYAIGGKTLKKARKPERYAVTGANDAATPAASDDEWSQASRALRTAGWGAVFYLITTDILGPFSTPWAFAAMGYGPAVVLYTIFGVCAALGGFLLWRMFLQLDSDRYPLRSYSDIAFRVYGPLARHFVNLLQSVQLLFNVGIIIVVNGLSLEQIITGSGHADVCFAILCFVWAVAGMLLGQIRTLRNLGWLATSAVFMNVFVIIMTMVVVAHTGVDRDVAFAANQSSFNMQGADDPVTTTAGQIPGTSFTTQVNGLGQAVYSYGGAMLFVEFMSEMKRPFDFWKGMIFAQAFIYFVYMFFGLFVYSYQGQFSVNPAYQGINPYAWQTVGNALGLVTGLIAALLYGNIGIKVIYNSVLMDLFRAPSLGSRGGKLLWIACVPIYWGIAFLIAAAIPQVSNLSAFIASLCILQFSYTFPPWLMLGFLMQRDGMLPGDGFDPATGNTVRGDRGIKRWVRGFRKQLLFNAWNLVFMLGSFTLAVIGIYSSIVGIIAAYGTKPGTSLSCTNPYGG